MAFNSWDKLVKAQRDYPNPKYAGAVADKATKKDPKNPYLLTWTVDIHLQQHAGGDVVLCNVMEKAHLQPIADTQLLAYMYRMYIEVLRRAEGTPRVNSIGNAALGTWQATAKNMQRKLDRVAMWDLLFYTAMGEDCWEDVRFAILNYNKEGPPDKKQFHYSLIIATQLSAEQRTLWKGPEDRIAQFQQHFVLKSMKQAYTAPPNDPIAVKTITDLRFMAKIFARQQRCQELHDLWDDPPKTLEPLLDRHRQDIQSMMIQHLWEQKAWPLLEQHCVGMIEDTLSNAHLVGGPKSKFWELCAWRWDLWSGLLAATHAMYPEQERQEFISNQMQHCFGNGLEAKDRPLQLTYIKLRQQIGVSMLSDCKDYFQHHSHLNSCFNDLKPIACRLSAADFKEFMKFTLTWTTELLGGSETSDNWRQHLVNMLKFHYLLAASMTDSSSSYQKFHGLIRAAIKISQLCPEDPDVGFLVVYTLLNLHADYVAQIKGYPNERLLLQAAMFARHLVEMDRDKENRTFALLATRLHLNLGLGTVAFRLYRHVKSKEMLTDTLSPYLLSRISQTHPFEVKGYGGFSAEKELTNVIDTIERMERKTDSFLFNEIPAFVWDQATDTLALKRKLGSSLTKHLCAIERRRIARLKGEPANELPKLDYKTYNEISDNVDHHVFPDFEHVGFPCRSRQLVTGYFSVPDKNWIADMHETRELPTRILYGEGPNGFDPHTSGYSLGTDDDSFRLDHTRTENLTRDFWRYIGDMTYHFAYKVGGNDDQSPVILKRLRSLRRGLDLSRMPGDTTTLKPEDEAKTNGESMLQWCFGLLEICRAIYKMCDWLYITVVKAKNHPMKADLSTKVLGDLQEESKIFFQTVRDLAESYITLLQRRGLRAFKAQVRWGVTGEALSVFLSDDDVEYYAKEYVESAVEAWKGVLKVKLK